jgi:hypothetical protein
MHCSRTGMGEYIFIRSLTQTFPEPETRCLRHKYVVMKKGKCRVCTEALYNIFWILYDVFDHKMIC